jgi:DNA-binding transcriptional LysR family regulator
MREPHATSGNAVLPNRDQTMHTTFDLQVFVALADTASLTEAARRCGVTRATVTRHLDALETTLGVVLVNRSTRQLSLTEGGLVYADSCRDALVHLRRAEASVRELDGTPRGQLRVSSPILALDSIVGPLVSDFARNFPTVDVLVNLSGDHADPLLDQCDVALHVGPATNPALLTRCLIRERLALYASPEYLARRGTPGSIAELCEHDCIVALREQVPETWPLAGGESLSIARPRLLANSSILVRSAVLNGLGIGLVGSSLIKNDLHSGALVRVLEDKVCGELPVSLLYAHGSRTSSKVRTFVDYALSWVEQHVRAG